MPSPTAQQTGRQFNRMGVPGVFGPDVTAGLPLNETTAADQMKKAGCESLLLLLLLFVWWPGRGLRARSCVAGVITLLQYVLLG